MVWVTRTIADIPNLFVQIFKNLAPGGLPEA